MWRWLSSGAEVHKANLILGALMLLCSCAASRTDWDRQMELHQKSIDAYEQGDKNASLLFIDSVVAINPRAVAAWSHKGRVEVELGRDLDGFASYNRSIQILEAGSEPLPRGSGQWIGRMYQERGLLKLKFGDTAGAVQDQKVGQKYLDQKVMSWRYRMFGIGR